ncbi:MAG: carboxymuconolactone decarboxylase family protein [Rhodospirillales bacterium]|nr:carboxymuconolactone decarboxylase family protein [Rhodospirillales bacterium]
MHHLTLHTRNSAPAGAHPIMDAYAQRFGFVPNLVAAMAESPAALKGYAQTYLLLGETDFTPAEQQLIFLTVSRTNGCTYCVAAHSMAGKMMGLDDETINAVRDGRPVLDPKLAGIVEFTTKMVEKRGHVSALDIETFLTAGHSKAQILEILLGIATKTISNYMNHIAATPLDDAFAATAWEPGAIAAQ